MLYKRGIYRFPSEHLPKNYIFKNSTFYTKDTTKRENILPLLPNSLNLLLVILWSKLISSWAPSTSASTSSWSWSPSQVLPYVVCTQVRRHVHKQITKRRYGEEKPGRFVFGKLVLFTIGLGLTMPYFLGILVWNFYQTFVIVSIEFWLRFQLQIRPTRFAIKFLLITARADRKVHLCVKLFYFFPRWILIRLN